jgi:hypothetical protein
MIVNVRIATLAYGTAGANLADPVPDRRYSFRVTPRMH